VWYGRRADAELVHAEDIDACFIREVDELGLIPGGPWRAENLGGWHLSCYSDEVCVAALSVAPLQMGTATQDEIFCRVCASALNRARSVHEQMREHHEQLIAHLLARDYTSEVLIQGPDKVELMLEVAQATDVSTIKLLHLLQEFMVANVVKWKMGANDHHHPIYGMVAEVLLAAKMPPITEGPEWAFIQPTNRTSLEDLRKRVDHGNQEATPN